ncbi:MAG: GNAT family N-acetyltransferase [Flavisolibacter sp.]|jgi:GNAT superfamily N-acetyltransferase
MVFREALVADIPQIQLVRHAVKENVLSNPALVSDKDCEEYLSLRGKGWVCDIEKKIVGFAIADLKDHNIWALFVLPEFAGKGIGKTLHNIMLDWYFTQTKEKVWLSTAPRTKAEKFYHLQGWKEAGRQSNGEVRFEMRIEEWRKKPL